MIAIGQPLSRIDGRLKTTGGARYTADIPVADVVYGVIVQSTIAKGRTVSIDSIAAEQAPGVLGVFTHRNMPRMNPTPKPWSHLYPHGQSYLPLQDDKILYADQPIALVVAATHDQAAFAGTLIRVEYETQPAAVFDRLTAKNAIQPPQFLWPVSSSVGDADKAISSSAVQIEETYSTADRHHNQMEPHATTAVWDDGTLTLYETTQHIFGARELVSMVLGIPQEKINVVCHYFGGGFGGKGMSAAYSHRSTRSEVVEQAGPRSAHASTNVFHGRPPGGEPAGNPTGCGAKWQAERHSPRQCYADVDVRQLHRVRGALSQVALGGQRWNRDQSQNRACESQHPDPASSAT